MESTGPVSRLNPTPHVDRADVVNPLLRLRGLQLRRGSRTIVTDATFDVAPGEIVALMGASGSGKTTILRTIAGLEPFDDGTVTVDHVTLQSGCLPAAALRSLKSRVGLVFQFHCLFEHLSALQNVWLAPVHALGVRRSHAEQRALELLRTLGVEHRAQALPRELSGGEAQRVAIARTLAMDPPVVLMDEPTASLDPTRRLELAALLRSLVTRDRALVIATHDEDFARESATRVLRVIDGCVCQ
jgi:ABC-type polar amino acid transport system ATPase subunit